MIILEACLLRLLMVAVVGMRLPTFAICCQYFSQLEDVQSSSCGLFA